MSVSIQELNQADRTLHSLSQLIALTAMQWLPSQPDDSQTNINWNSHQQRLEGRTFVRDNQPTRLVIDADAFILQFMDDQGQVHTSFSPEGRTPLDAMNWWRDQMQSWGIDTIKGLNYTLDKEPVDPQTTYQRPSGLASWAYWRSMANTALQALTEASGQKSESRIWPHHFDTGVYYTQPDSSDQEKAAIWAGYAIADSLCDEPYFYLSGYKRQESINFSKAPTLSVGEWRNTPTWKGALLPIPQAADGKDITLFLQESYAWLEKETHTD
jgi:hypothetical protein